MLTIVCNEVQASGGDGDGRDVVHDGLGEVDLDASQDGAREVQEVEHAA